MRIAASSDLRLHGRGLHNAIDAPRQHSDHHSAFGDAPSPTLSTRPLQQRTLTTSTQLFAMPSAEAIRRRFDRIPEEPKTAEDHPFVAACLLFVFVFFFISVLSTFLNSSAQYQKELAAAEARKKAKKDE